MTVMTAEEYEARKRRLEADYEDAKKTLNSDRSNFDRIADELRELRTARQAARKEQ